MRECQSVSELSIREVSDGRERVERAAPPVTRGHSLALDGAGLTLGRPKIIAKLSRDRLDFGTHRSSVTAVTLRQHWKVQFCYAARNSLPVTGSDYTWLPAVAGWQHDRRQGATGVNPLAWLQRHLAYGTA